jgi:putative ABC transport system ATP-binding protein
MTVVIASDIAKTYGDGARAVHALRAVSLIVEEGAMCAVAGPSGSGKSTLLALLGGLDVPSAGALHVGGRALHRMTPAQRTRFRAEHVGFVFQAPNLVPVLTAAENVALPLTLRAVTAAERTRRVVRLLDDVGLRDVAARRPAELSGGQQQRVALARALAADPALVLADEPTAHLDSITARTVMQLLRTLSRARRTAIVLATHDPLVESMADLSVSLRDGAVVAAGATPRTDGPCRPCSISAYGTSSAIPAARA